MPIAPECRARQYLGGMTVCWFGLCIAEAILAISLLHATPAEHVYPVDTLKLTMSVGVLMALISKYPLSCCFTELPL